MMLQWSSDDRLSMFASARGLSSCASEQGRKQEEAGEQTRARTGGRERDRKKTDLSLLLGSHCNDKGKGYREVAICSQLSLASEQVELREI
jgi:hypothetical protein